jgi:hypothetical protein
MSHQASASVSKSAKRWHRARVIIILLLPLLGAIGGVLFYFVGVYAVPSGEWHKLSSPPETVDKVLSTSNTLYKVYVRTTTDAIYACPTLGRTADATLCEKVPVEQSTATISNCDFFPHYTAPPPPGEVVDRLEVFPCGHYGCFGDCQQTLVALKDGSLWEHIVGEQEMGGLMLYVLPIVGAGIGVVAMLMLWIMGRISRAHKQ